MLRIPAFPMVRALASVCPVAEAAAPEDVAAEGGHRPVSEAGFQVKAAVRLPAEAARNLAFCLPVVSGLSLS